MMLPRLSLVSVVFALACELPPPDPVLVATAPPSAPTLRTNVWVSVPPATALQSAATAMPAAPTPTTPTSPTVEVSRGVRVTTFQRRQLLGHYATLDGKTGFVLDRTVDPPRARIDGDLYVKNLDIRPSLRCCVEYAAGSLWLRVDKETGAVLEFVGPLQTERSVRVIRDADAEPLPVP
jgi:hypothetical protein